MKSYENIAYISGWVAEEFQISYIAKGKKFYSSFVDVQRNSGVIDRVPIIVPENFIDVTREWTGAAVYVFGKFRSFNKEVNGKRKLLLYLFAKRIYVIALPDRFENKIHLTGYLCKAPVYRKTPKGYEITELLMAVNKSKWKSDYIPCICWGDNARWASGLQVGAHISITGRMQSREYTKKLNESESEIRTAYEVSISQMEVIEGEECKDQVDNAE